MIDYSKEFAQKYMPFHECRISTFRNSLAFCGMSFPPSFLFGLSGNYIFFYNDPSITKRSIFRMVTGINDQSIETLSTGLNCHLKRNVFEINDNYFKFIYETLRKNEIVNICVDFFDLHKFVYKKESHNQDMFDSGSHYVSVVGCDIRNKSIIIVDTNSSKHYVIDEFILRNIWFKDKEKPTRPLVFSANGEWYTFSQPEKFSTEDILHLALTSIRKVIFNFFTPSTPTLVGFNALKLYKADIDEWFKNTLDLKQIYGDMKMSYYFNKNLNGGGLARKQYAFFLNSLSELLKDEELLKVASKFLDTSQFWTKYMEAIHKVANLSDGLRSHEKLLKSLFGLVYKAEIEQMESLKKWYNKKGLGHYSKLII